MGKELDKRLQKLEQALPEARRRTPHRDDFERRCRIVDLYRAWWFEGGEEPDLGHPRDRYWWAYMEQLRGVIDEMVAEGVLGDRPDNQ